jgi:hypothetical protein
MAYGLLASKKTQFQQSHIAAGFDQAPLLPLLDCISSELDDLLQLA